MRPLRIPDASALRAALAREIRHSEHARYLNRLHCLLLVARRRSCYDVAACFGESPRAVERWVHRFRRRGVDGLREVRRGHAPGSRRLTVPQLDALRRDLRASPRELGFEQRRWTGRLLLAHIASAYGIRFSLRHCQRLLREHGA